jgi:hypothetical protein
VKGGFSLFCCVPDCEMYDGCCLLSEIEKNRNKDTIMSRGACLSSVSLAGLREEVTHVVQLHDRPRL